jgi:hypothetical protein
MSEFNSIFSKFVKTWMKIPKQNRLDIVDELLGNSVDFSNLNYAFVLNSLMSYETDHKDKDDVYLFYEYNYHNDISIDVYNKMLMILEMINQDMLNYKSIEDYLSSMSKYDEYFSEIY